MSRSYHITTRKVVKRVAAGDHSAIIEFAEKRNLKTEHKRFRKVYGKINPSDKSPNLRNSVTASCLKKVMKKKK